MNIQSSFDYFLKIVIVGDSGVGKSNFLLRFISGRYNSVYQPTIGSDFHSKIITLPKTKQNIKLQFWDTAGQEKYRAMNKIYFQKVQGIILAYDITCRESYERLGDWVKLINDNIDYAPILLIGNKVDDATNNRIVRLEEGKKFADEHDFLFFETSALRGTNVDKAMYSLCEKIISHLDNKNSYDFNLSVSLNDVMKDTNKNRTDKKVACC